jgi:predicted nucleic acid-binding protein
MILLDTSILTEMLKAKPDPKVAAWLAAQPAGSVFVSTIAEAELRQAAMLLSQRRREEMMRIVEGIFREDFAGRVLPFDSFAAAAYAQVIFDRRTAGKGIGQLDAMVAGIARSRGAKLATKNGKEGLEGCGVEVVNPWEYGAS